MFLKYKTVDKADVFPQFSGFQLFYLFPGCYRVIHELDAD